jgi:hypothetical protein
MSTPQRLQKQYLQKMSVSDRTWDTQLFLEARKLEPREKKIKIHKWSFDKQDASLYGWGLLCILKALHKAL